MKIWIKLLVGSVLGVIAGIFIPAQAQGFFDSLAGLLVGIGRYVLFPFVFFSLGIGTSELRQEKRLARVYLSSLKYLALSAGLLVLIGTLSVLVFPPERIPITVEAEKAFASVSVMDGLRAIFPRNLFSVFWGSGDFLLPLIVLAFLLGVNMDFDRQLTRPIVQIFDSLSRIFYHLNSLVVELFGLAMIVITAAWMMRISHADLGMYKQILIILAVDVGIVVFGVFPGCLYLLGVKENPYRWLYAAMGPAIAGLFTGDAYLSLGVLSKHGKLGRLPPVRRSGKGGHGDGRERLLHPDPSLILQPRDHFPADPVGDAVLIHCLVRARGCAGQRRVLLDLHALRDLREGAAGRLPHPPHDRAAPRQPRSLRRRCRLRARLALDRARGERVDRGGNGELYLREYVKPSPPPRTSWSR
jgi:hypothetical protein